MANDTELIIRLRADVQRLSKDLNIAKSKMNAFRGYSTSFAKNITGTLAASFGAFAIGSAITSSIQKIAGFEYQMDKVAAVSRASADEIEALKKNALDLGASTKFTATEIANMQEQIARLGFTTPKILDTTDAIRKLATVADAELGASAEVMVKTLNAFNLSAKESERVANVMAESFSMSALNLEDFSVGMSYAATAGKTFGLNIEQVTAMLGTLVDSGIQAQKAGTGLRDIFTDLAVKGITLDQAYKMVNESADKTKTAFDLVGKTSMNQLIILAEQEKKTADLTAAFSDQNKELDSMVKVMEDNLLTDWKLFTSAIDGLIQRGGALNEFFRASVQGLTKLVNGINNAFGGSETLADQIIDKHGLQNLSDFVKLLDTASGKNLGISDMTKGLIEQKLLFKELSKEGVEIYNAAIEQGITTSEDFLRVKDEFINKYREEADNTIVVNAILDMYKQKLDAAAESIENVSEAKKNAFKLPEPIDDDFFASFIDPDLGGSVNLNTFSNLFDQAAQGFGLGSDMLGEAIDLDFSKQISDDLAKSMLAWDQYVKEATKKYTYLIELTNIAEGTMEDAISSFIEGLGTGGVDSAFSNLLNVIGQGLINFGKALIAYGISLDAFKKAITNPYLAVAAGAAAIAVGSVVSRAASNLSKSVGGGGISGSASGGPAGFQTASTGQTSFPKEIQLKAKGSDLVGVLKVESSMQSRTRVN